MHDPFLSHNDISASKTLELIKNYQFIEPNYHTDDFGHVQVEIPNHERRYSLSSLLNLIEREQQWPALVELLSSNNEHWLLNLSIELQKQTYEGALYCLVSLIDAIESIDIKIVYLQNSAQWPWHIANIVLLDKTINSLVLIEKDLMRRKGVSEEIDLSIVSKTLTDLQLVKAKFEGQKMSHLSAKN